MCNHLVDGYGCRQTHKLSKLKDTKYAFYSTNFSVTILGEIEVLNIFLPIGIYIPNSCYSTPSLPAALRSVPV